MINQLNGQCVKLSYIPQMIESNLIPELNEIINGYFVDYYTVNENRHWIFIDKFKKVWAGNYRKAGAYSIYVTSNDKIIDGLSLPADYFAMLVKYLNDNTETENIRFTVTSVRELGLFTSRWLGEEDEAKRENEIQLILEDEI